MDTLIHADIFFFISTIALVILSAILIIAGTYAILALQDARYIVSKARKAADDIEGSLGSLQERLSGEGGWMGLIFDFFLRKISERKAAVRKKRSAKADA